MKTLKESFWKIKKKVFPPSHPINTDLSPTHITPIPLLSHEGFYTAIVNVNCGTTVKGAVDNIDHIEEVLNVSCFYTHTPPTSPNSDLFFFLF